MFAAIAIFIVALLLVLTAPKPHIENARAAKLGDFQFPRSNEGDPVAWILGRVRLNSPNTLWYGDYTPIPIVKKQKSLFSSKSYVVGYKNHIGADLCWCLGDGVTVRHIWADKYDLWDGVLSGNGTIDINLPNLQGGEEQSGGMVGTIVFYSGRFNETRDPYLVQKASPDVPAYIGQCRMVFKGSARTQASGFYFGTQKNILPINAELERHTTYVSPTYSVMPNGADVNPMEAIYAALTEKFGMLGQDPLAFDMVSFQRDAKTLYDEGMGMSIAVQSSITGKDVAEEVLRIADGVVFQEPTTGLITSKLIRQDYVIADLPVLDETIVTELTDFSKTTWDQTFNQCRVTFHDRSNAYAEKVATAQDFANINFQGRIQNTDISMPCCFVSDEANTLAARQLNFLDVPLYSIEVRCKRKTASRLRPGDAFVFNWPLYGLTGMVMRVQKVNLGTLEDGTVTINAVQDRFSVATALFAAPGGSAWTPPVTAAAPVLNRRIWEAPNWLSQFAATAMPDGQGMLLALAAPPSGASVVFDADYTSSGDSLWANPTRILDDSPYYGGGVLLTAYPATAGQTNGLDAVGFTLTLVDKPASLTPSTDGSMMILLDDELMTAANITDNGDGTWAFSNVQRALLDTTFGDHAANARAYLVKLVDNALETFFSNTAALRVRLIDNTPVSTLDPSIATQDVVTLAQRAFLPAPVKNVQLNGSRTPAAYSVATGPLPVSWSTRNRKTLPLRNYTSDSDAPEPNTDFGVRYRINGGAWSAFAYVAASPTTLDMTGKVGACDVEVWARRDGTLLSRVGDRCSVTLTA